MEERDTFFILHNYICLFKLHVSGFFEKYPGFEEVNAKWGVEFGSEEEKEECHYSDYRNLFNLEGHRNTKTKDELVSLRSEYIQDTAFVHSGFHSNGFLFTFISENKSVSLFPNRQKCLSHLSI